MNTSSRVRNLASTAMFLAVAAAGFLDPAAPSGGDSPQESQSIIRWGDETFGQRCSVPVDEEWRDWTRPRGVAIPR
jgi:hypothetical protein